MSKHRAAVWLLLLLLGSLLWACDSPPGVSFVAGDGEAESAAPDPDPAWEADDAPVTPADGDAADETAEADSDWTEVELPETGTPCERSDWICADPLTAYYCDPSSETWTRKTCELTTDNCEIRPLCTPGGCQAEYFPAGSACFTFGPAYCSGGPQGCVLAPELLGKACPQKGTRGCFVLETQNSPATILDYDVYDCNTDGVFAPSPLSYGPATGDCGERALTCDYLDGFLALCPCGDGASCDGAPRPVTTLSVQPYPLDFGPQDVLTNVSRRISLRNVLSARCTARPDDPLCRKPITLGNFILEGNEAGAFRLDTALPRAGESPLLLRAGQALEVEITFSPKALDTDFQAVLRFSQDADRNPYGAAGADIQLKLSGRWAMAKLCATPTALHMEAIAVGVPSFRSVVLSNCGELPFDIHSIGWEGPASCSVNPENAVGTTLLPNGNTEITVVCTPNDMESLSGQITVVLSNSRFLIPVSYAAAPCRPLFTPDDVLQFGQVNWYESRTKTLTIRNPCSSSMQILSAAVSPSDGVFTLLAPAFPRSLGSQVTMELQVVFKAPGLQTTPSEGLLSITGNGWGLPNKNILLRGLAVFPEDGDTAPESPGPSRK